VILIDFQFSRENDIPCFVFSLELVDCEESESVSSVQKTPPLIFKGTRGSQYGKSALTDAPSVSAVLLSAWLLKGWGLASAFADVLKVQGDIPWGGGWWGGWFPMAKGQHQSLEGQTRLLSLPVVQLKLECRLARFHGRLCWLQPPPTFTTPPPPSPHLFPTLYLHQFGCQLCQAADPFVTSPFVDQAVTIVSMCEPACAFVLWFWCIMVTSVNFCVVRLSV